MTQAKTIIFGIPVPSDNKLFLAIVIVHILLGIACVLSMSGHLEHLWIYLMAPVIGAVLGVFAWNILKEKG